MSLRPQYEDILDHDYLPYDEDLKFLWEEKQNKKNPKKTATLPEENH